MKTWCCLLNDPYTNPQLIKNCFIKTSYTFTLNILNKKYDKVISAALRNTNAYESHFSTIFHQLLISSHPKNVICTVHTKSCYELNKHIRTLIINLFKVIKLTKHQHDNLTTDSNKSTQNTHHRFFLSSPIVLKTLTYKAPSEIMTPSPRCISSSH